MRDVVLRFFDDEGIEVDAPEGTPLIRAGFTGDNGRFVGFARAIPERSIFFFVSLSPLEAPPERRSAVLELCARINVTLLTSSLDCDPETGEIRARAAVDCEGQPLTTQLVKNVVYASVATLDRFLPALTAVITKGLDVQRALQSVQLGA